MDEQNNTQVNESMNIKLEHRPLNIQPADTGEQKKNEEQKHTDEKPNTDTKASIEASVESEKENDKNMEITNTKEESIIKNDNSKIEENKIIENNDENIGYEEKEDDDNISDSNENEENDEDTVLDELIGKENDLSLFISQIIGDDNAINNIFDKFDKKYTTEEIKQMMSDPNSYLSKLYAAHTKRLDSKQVVLLHKLISNLYKENKKLKEAVKGLKDKISRGKKTSKEAGTVKLKGKDAKLTVLARLKGLKRVYLYNSGFYLDIRPMELAELSEFYYSVREETQEYGRLLGGHFYTYEDIFIKDKFCELLPLIVESSNFKEFHKPQMLLKNISFHDIETLMWACCVLQYRKGIEIEAICTNPECQYIESEFHIDLNKLRFNVFDNMSPEAIEFIMNGKNLTSGDLRKYREEILKFKKEIVTRDTETDTAIIYHLKVPTITEWLNEGRSLMAKLAAVLNDEFSLKNERSRQEIMIHIYKMLKPWIEKISFYDQDGDLDFETDEHDAIMSLLDAQQQERSDLKTKIVDFIKDTKISYFCYSGIACPKCGKKPEDNIEDFIPVDVQQIFFYLACRRLILAGIK